MAVTIIELINTLPHVGSVKWIGVRPAKSAPMVPCEQVEVQVGQGIIGDRFKATRTDREVTLIQSEHIIAIGSMLGRYSLSHAIHHANDQPIETTGEQITIQPIDPSILRRNIVIEGLNLLALKGKQFRIGSVVMEYTGLAHPCSKMEVALGPGGYNAMRGHGGITARVIASGILHRLDSIVVHDQQN